MKYGYISLFILTLLIVSIKASEIPQDENLVEEAMLYGKGLGPEEDSSPAEKKLSINYSGNRRIIQELATITLENIDEFIVVEVQLHELAKFINSRIANSNKWKITVNADAKELRVSGKINKDLMMSLIRLMQEEKFHCRVTDGVVEFKKGRNSLMQNRALPK